MCAIFSLAALSDTLSNDINHIGGGCESLAVFKTCTAILLIALYMVLERFLIGLVSIFCVTPTPSATFNTDEHDEEIDGSQPTPEYMER